MGRRHFNPLEQPEDPDPAGEGSEEEQEGADFQVEEVLRERELSILVRLDTGDEKWVPKAVIHDDSEVFEMGHTGKLVIYHSFAERNDWL